MIVRPPDSLSRFRDRTKRGTDILGGDNCGLVMVGTVLPSQHYAGFWIRFAARLIDTVIIVAANCAAIELTGAALGSEHAVGIESFLLSASGTILFEAGFLAWKGATPGKLLLKLKVVTVGGGSLSWARALARYGCYFWLDSLMFGTGCVMASVDSEKRALHDRICQTRVLRTIGRSKSSY
jgi:uncharacterized RDD family membrane protein YckC